MASTTLASNLLVLGVNSPVGTVERATSSEQYQIQEQEDFLSKDNDGVDEIILSEIVSLFDTSTDDLAIIKLTGAVPNPLQAQSDWLKPQAVSSPEFPLSPLPKQDNMFIDRGAIQTVGPHKISERVAPKKGALEVAPNASFDLNAKAVTPEKRKIVHSSNIPKKRKTSSCKTSADEAAIVSDVDEEAKRERNRLHARKSRQRKKSLTVSIQRSLEILKAENAKLRGFIYLSMEKEKAKARIEVAASRTSRANDFVAALKKPENCLLDSETIEFIQGLRAKIPTHAKDHSAKVVG